MTDCANVRANKQLQANVTPGGADSRKAGSEMGQPPVQGDKDKNNSGRHVWNVYFVPGPVLRALRGASH